MGLDVEEPELPAEATTIIPRLKAISAAGV
jgi:hypothetical protein